MIEAFQYCAFTSAIRARARIGEKGRRGRGAKGKEVSPVNLRLMMMQRTMSAIEASNVRVRTYKDAHADT